MSPMVCNHGLPRLYWAIWALTDRYGAGAMATMGASSMGTMAVVVAGGEAALKETSFTRTNTLPPSPREMRVSCAMIPESDNTNPADSIAERRQGRAA